VHEQAAFSLSAGHFLGGIECDGVMYNGAATARDRDRLRQEVLEQLGWKLIRVWSPLWYQNKEVQIKRIFDFVEEQKKRVKERKPRLAEDSNVATTSTEQADTKRISEVAAEIAVGVDGPPAGELASCRSPADSMLAEKISIKRAPLPVYSLTPVKVLGDAEAFKGSSDEDVLATIRTVLDYEAPIHLEDLRNRVASHWRIARIGSRVSKRIDVLIDSIIKNEGASLKGEFVWNAGQKEVAARTRKIKGETFSAESLPPEELDAFIVHVLSDGKSKDKDQIVACVAKAIGFGKASQALTERIRPRIQFMLETSVLEPCSTGVRLATPNPGPPPYAVAINSPL